MPYADTLSSPARLSFWLLSLRLFLQRLVGRVECALKRGFKAARSLSFVEYVFFFSRAITGAPMPLSPEMIGPMLVATREAAAAFYEDIPHIRSLLGKEVTGGEIRRLSAVLRRLLVEQDLRTIATPRLNRKIKMHAPDNTNFYHAERDIGSPLLFFGTTPSKIFDSATGAIFALEARSLSRGIRRSKKLTNPQIRQLIDLPFDNFMNQRVLCLRGEWVNRREAIKYMANMASGVHSSPPKEPQEKLLSVISRSASYKFKEDGLAIELFNGGLDNKNPEFRYSPDSINPVMVELLAAGRLLIDSPDVAELLGMIDQELKAP